MRPTIWMMILAVLLLPIPAHAQQEATVSQTPAVSLQSGAMVFGYNSGTSITVSPQVAEDRHPIEATLNTAIPVGAKIEGPGWICPDGVRGVPIGDTRLHIWADPGKHTIGYKAFWVLIQPFTFKDGDGNEQTIDVYKGHGLVEVAASFQVGGDGPDPPDPDPPTPGKLSVLLSYEAGDQAGADPAQADLITDPTVRAYLNAHCVVVDGQPAWRFLDLSNDDGSKMPAPWQAAIARARGKTPPWLIIDSGKTYEGPCPASAAELLAKLKQYGGE